MNLSVVGGLGGGRYRVALISHDTEEVLGPYLFQ